MGRHDQGTITGVDEGVPTSMIFAQAAESHDFKTFTRLESFLSSTTAAAGSAPATAAPTGASSAPAGSAPASSSLASSAPASSSGAAAPSSGPNTGMIIGLAVGIPVLLAVAGGAAWLFLRRRRRASPSPGGGFGIGGPFGSRKGSANPPANQPAMSRSTSSSSSVWGTPAPAAPSAAARAAMADTEMQPLNGGAPGYHPTAYAARRANRFDDEDPDANAIESAFEPSRSSNPSYHTPHGEYSEHTGDYDTAGRTPAAADVAAAAAGDGDTVPPLPTMPRRQPSYAVSALSAPRGRSSERGAATSSSGDGDVSPVDDEPSGLPPTLIDQMRLANARFPSVGDGGETFQAMVAAASPADDRRHTQGGMSTTTATTATSGDFEELPLHMPEEEQAHAHAQQQHAAAQAAQAAANPVFEENKDPAGNRF